jgi:endonuclease/exonuclease/phosphatase (EEP) superfamily protein YafD
VGLCAALAGLIAGRLGLLWVWFDVFSQFSAQFVMLALGFSVGMIVPRFKALTGVVLTALMVTAYGMWPHRLNDVPSGAVTPPDGAMAIKVASFNSFYVNSDLAAQRDEILRLDADVITLIEFSSPKTPILADLRKKYPYVYDGRSVPECLLVIVSKFPLKNGECRGLWKGPPMIRATVDTGKGGLTVLGVHTTRFPHSRSQLKQVNELIHQIEGIPGNIVMMGDFNATPFSRMVQSISASTGLVRQQWFSATGHRPCLHLAGHHGSCPATDRQCRRQRPLSHHHDACRAPELARAIRAAW